VFFTLKDGREVDAALLSDGYKRLVSIVIDMAERCSILNRPMYNENAVKETKGIAILDEIDLHLHPSLQSRVIDGLKRAFPGVQFILSTHSPMVMSGVKNDESTVVYRMSYDSDNKTYALKEVKPYGMDISSIAKYILDLPDRTISVQVKLDRLRREIEDEKYDTAMALLEELTKEVGPDIKELIEARTIINLEADLYEAHS
jgi:predicted ATP-binding protein involved in virulence